MSQPAPERVPAPDCLVGRVVYGDRECEGPGTYYCDDELWGSACRRFQERARERRDTPAEAMARRWHDTYERLAPAYGYTTRRESARPWHHVPAANRRLMIATAQAILDQDALAAHEETAGG